MIGVLVLLCSPWLAIQDHQGLAILEDMQNTAIYGEACDVQPVSNPSQERYPGPWSSQHSSCAWI
jgi:hypothetical protein